MECHLLQLADMLEDMNRNTSELASIDDRLSISNSISDGDSTIVQMQKKKAKKSKSDDKKCIIM